MLGVLLDSPGQQRNPWVRLFSQRQGCRFYQKQSFRQVKQQYIEAGIVHIEMSLDLKNENNE